MFHPSKAAILSPCFLVLSKFNNNFLIQALHNLQAQNCESEQQSFRAEMLPLRCLSFLLLSAVVIYCDEEATETLIEMKGDKLDEQETTGTERVVVDENGEVV